MTFAKVEERVKEEDEASQATRDFEAAVLRHAEEAKREVVQNVKL